MTKLSQIDEAYKRLTEKETGGRSDLAHCPQWVLWFDLDDRRFDELVEILDSKKLSGKERQILIDAVAMTPLNITPSRAQWIRDYGLKWMAKAEIGYVPELNLIDALEYTAIASCPFDPSQGDGYKDLWTGFKGSRFTADGAFEWLKC